MKSGRVAKKEDLNSRVNNYFINKEDLVRRGVEKFFFERRDDEFYDFYYQWYQGVMGRVIQYTSGALQGQGYVIAKATFADYLQSCFFTLSRLYSKTNEFNAQSATLYNVGKSLMSKNTLVLILHPSHINRSMEMVFNKAFGFNLFSRWFVNSVPQEFRENDTNSIIILCLDKNQQTNNNNNQLSVC